MTEPSPQSSTPSPKAGKDSESQSQQLATVIQAKRRDLGVVIEPVSTLKTSLPKLSPISCSDEEIEQRWARENQQRESQAKHDRMMSLWDAAGIPARHQRPFTAAEDSPWFGAFEEVMGSPRGSTLLLCGNRGTGKTQLACKVAAQSCRNLESARYTTAVEFFLHLREAMKGENVDASERRLLTEYSAYHLLIIDEAHERGETDWEDRMLTHLLDRRYRELRTTILITNQRKAEALDALGPSIVDRIRECGGIIECSWPSFRQRA